MIYEMMVPPFEHGKFSEMNKKQTEQYFNWYVGQIEYRIKQLIDLIHDEGVEYEFDYSIDSLVPIWKWLETKISYRVLSDEEYQNKLEKYPEWMAEYIQKKEFSYETLMYVADVAMYFAEVMIKNNDDKIKWGYFTKPKKRQSVNEPVLLGFKNNDDLNPRIVLLNLLRKSSEETDEKRLYNIYHVWMKYID